MRVCTCTSNNGVDCIKGVRELHCTTFFSKSLKLSMHLRLSHSLVALTKKQVPNKRKTIRDDKVGTQYTIIALYFGK